MTPDQQSRLLELFAACSRESLTEAEHQELQAVLQGDRDARQLWFLHQDLDLGLKRLTQIVEGTADLSGDAEPVEIRSARAHVGPDIHLPANVTNSSRFSRLIRRNQTITAVALLCLSAMVMFGIHIGTRPSKLDLAAGNTIASHRPGNFTVESPTHGTKFTRTNHKGKVIACTFY